MNGELGAGEGDTHRGTRRRGHRTGRRRGVTTRVVSHRAVRLEKIIRGEGTLTAREGVALAFGREMCLSCDTIPCYTDSCASASGT